MSIFLEYPSITNYPIFEPEKFEKLSVTPYTEQNIAVLISRNFYTSQQQVKSSSKIDLHQL